jgi:integrase
LVFTSDFDGPVDPRNLLRAAELAAANAGIENVGSHTLGHCACCRRRRCP